MGTAKGGEMLGSLWAIGQCGFRGDLFEGHAVRALYTVHVAWDRG